MSGDLPSNAPSLRREVGLLLFLFYGLGNIVGAGIYVLIGKVAGAAGYGAPLAFSVAAVVAGFTGLSYGELAARYPHASGEAVYLYKAFRVQSLSTVVGLLIALAGLVSAATIARGFVGYFQVFVDVPDELIMIAVLAAITLLAARGIIESALANAVVTIVQVGGLVWIITAGIVAWPTFDVPAMAEFIPADNLAWSGVIAGAFLAFYAFIGFEDMVNLAEEVREPARTIPKAIVLAFVLAAIVYVLLATVAVIAVAPVALSASEIPLVAVCEQVPWCSPLFINLISLTVINGALIQIIMAARIFYGMSKQGWLPPFLSVVHPKRRTPLVATLLAGGIALMLALTLPFVSLAKLTSAMVLTIFILVNASLIVIKRRQPVPEDVRPIWLVVPVAGLVGSVLILLL